MPNPSFPIVGIGASAGGLEAVSQFLRHLPTDTGMAFVLVQHLDRHHESILADLLSRVTEMPVRQAEERMLMEPNRVYVIPPAKDIALANGVLTLTSRVDARGQHMPIDLLFRSLAEAQGHQSIGIILSGNGSDGTLGVTEINKKGGLTFVQDPQSAQFDSMPRSAIATEQVNFVLAPDRIAKQLAEIARHPYLKSVSNGHGEMAGSSNDEDTAFVKILNLVRTRTGVDFGNYKQNTIHRRVLRRMVIQKAESFSDYLSYLDENPSEVGDLYNDILIKVTRFFRDPKEFEILKTRIFPEIIKAKSENFPVRVWVPGCSTGEEVYSIAIFLHEFLEENGRKDQIQIFGTDVSESALEKARAGLYAESIETDVSPERLRRFFVKKLGLYQINKPVRDMCIFAKQNVLRDPPFSKLDLISCRNLLIYLNSDLQKKVLSIFHFSLKTNGWLMLGAAETIGAIPGLFSVVDKTHRIFLKEGMSRLTHLDSGAGAPEKEPEVRANMPGAHGNGVGAVSMQKEVDRVLIRRYAPTGVIINNRLEILQFRGDTTPYLANPQGEASFNILRMAREGLRAALDEAIRDVKKKKVLLRKTGIRFRSHGQLKEVNIEVIPIRAPFSEEHWWAIMFDDSQKAAPLLKKKKPSPKGSSKSQKTGESARLIEELESTKAYLESIIQEKETANEELQSAHEEVLSSNEEFQSINEELQTAKEELQSTNEELLTLNNELQSANQQGLELVNDLNNLFDSEDIPIIMVGKDLRIRRFTPLAEKALNLIPTDIGRPITDLKPRINIIDLEKLILDVIQTATIKDQYVQDEGGRWYAVRIRPYKTVEKKIEGAVVILIDVDTLMRSEQSAAEAKKEIGKLNIRLEERVLQRTAELTAANKELEAFCYSVSHDLRTPLRGINGFCRLLGKDYGYKLDTRGQDHLQRVRAATERMSQLIDDLLSLSRLGRTKMLYEDVDLSELAKGIAGELQKSQPDRQVDFVISPGLKAKGDKNLLKIAFLNLLDNAWKFTGKKLKARIEFGLTGEVGESVYFVRDNGAGFDMAYHEKLFDAFQRLHSDTEFPGTGVGLTTVQRIIERHGGRVWADGKIDQGATFYFTLNPSPPVLEMTTLAKKPVAVGGENSHE